MRGEGGVASLFSCDSVEKQGGVSSPRRGQGLAVRHLTA